MKLTFLLIATFALCAAARAQTPAPPFAHLAGQYYPVAFAGWRASSTTPVLAPGMATVVVTPPLVSSAGGDETFPPATAGVPVSVLDGATSEIITPVSVACSTSSCTLTADFAHAHPGGFSFASANLGLNEAITVAAAHGGGTVVVSSDWRGSTTQLTTAAGTAKVALEDLRAGNDVRYIWNGTQYAAATDLTVTGQPGAPSLESVYLADHFCAILGTLDQSCIQGALSAIGPAQATLFIPSGNYAIGANLTIPNNVTLQFARGAVWTVAVPYVVQINGPLIAGNYQIFNTTLPTQTTGAMTSGSATLTSTGLSAADVGSAVYVAGASATSVSVPVADYLGMGVGNGTQTTFTYTSTHVPMNTGSVQVWDAVTRGVDNGSGSIAPPWPLTGITGTVNYATGAVSVTFASAPASGTFVQIGYGYNQDEPLTGTINSVASSTSATVSFNAATTVSNSTVMFGGSYVKFGSGYVSSLNPMWWGAVGDGSTDSTAALQASMTACGDSQLPLSVPSGTYITNATLDAGDPFQLGIYNTSFAIVGGACSIVGQRGGSHFGQQKAVTFQAGSSFPSGANILQRENADGIDWENFYVNGNNTGANGIDVNWAWIGGTPSPDIKDVFQHLTIQNYGRMGMLADNCNGCTLRDVNIAQATGTVPIALQLDGSGGKIDLFQSSFYNGIVRLDAQNGDIFGGGFYDGLDLTGQGRNDFVIQGPQIFANADTGIALDSTNTSGEGTDLVSCTACWFGGGSGQSMIAGRWGRDLRLVGDAFYQTTGSPSFFGTITSGLTPTFDLYNIDGNVSPSTPNVGNLIQHTGYNTSATITSAPMTFESLTVPTAGYLCLGSGTCNNTTNFALGSNGGSLTIGAGYANVTVPAITATTYTVATLPPSPAKGELVVVTDAASYVAGPCTGGGSDTMIAVYNWSAWTCH